MSRARKGADLRRDPRFALHGPTRDPPDGHPAAWPGEVKVAGRARYGGEHDAEESAGEIFRADLDEVVFTECERRRVCTGDRVVAAGPAAWFRWSAPEAWSGGGCGGGA